MDMHSSLHLQSYDTTRLWVHTPTEMSVEGERKEGREGGREEGCREGGREGGRERDARREGPRQEEGEEGLAVKTPLYYCTQHKQVYTKQKLPHIPYLTSFKLRRLSNASTAATLKPS